MSRLPNRLRRRLLAIAAALGLTVALPAAAEPALWVVKDADSTIYLFGSVHALKPGLDWHSRKIAGALSESSELVLEVGGLDDAAAVQALMRAHGLDAQTPLSSRLSATDRARLAEAAKLAGLPPQALEPMKPWLAALVLSMAPLTKAGYQADSGVEQVLTTQAKALGRRVTGLETMGQQIGFFAGLPEAQQVALLSATLESVSEAEVEVDRLVAAWLADDQAALEAAVVDEMPSSTRWSSAAATGPGPTRSRRGWPAPASAS